MTEVNTEQVAAARRQDQVREYKRALIRDAAKSVFAERGIDRATLREIATRAGWTTGAIYQYFESKEELYAAVLRDSLENLRWHVREAIDGAESARTRAGLLALFAYYDERVEEFDLGFYLYNGTKPVGLAPDLNAELNDLLDATVRLIAAALVADEVAGESGAHQVAMAHVTSVFGLILVTKTGRLRSMGEGHTPEQILDTLFSALP